jgi:carbonic anhydrase
MSYRLALVTFLVSSTLLSAQAIADESVAPAVTPDAALKKLEEGNQRYISGKVAACKDSDAAKRARLAKSQAPFAIVLSCSDSRVPPEIVFDQSMGEIFVVRVAGNVVDPVILGSIEYAAEHLGSPLIMVLGHERCGAVTAAVNASPSKKPEGNIGSIVKSIEPAVAVAKKASAKGAEPAVVVDTAISKNVELVVESLTKKSPVLAHLVKEGKVKIVGARYDLDDGKVSLLTKP